MFLFKVENHFMVTGRGLVLCPGLREKKVKLGSKIKIIRPDNSIIETIIRGVSFSEVRDVLVGSDLMKEDVPIHSEVWLSE